MESTTRIIAEIVVILNVVVTLKFMFFKIMASRDKIHAAISLSFAVERYNYTCD